jgi:hypothetical protein
MVATQRTAPKPAAATPDFLIMSPSCVVEMDRWGHPLEHFPAKPAAFTVETPQLDGI